MTIQTQIKDEFFEKDASTSSAVLTAINAKTKPATIAKTQSTDALSIYAKNLLTPFEGYGLNDLNNVVVQSSLVNVP